MSYSNMIERENVTFWLKGLSTLPKIALSCSNWFFFKIDFFLMVMNQSGQYMLNIVH